MMPIKEKLQKRVNVYACCFGKTKQYATGKDMDRKVNMSKKDLLLECFLFSHVKERNSYEDFSTTSTMLGTPFSWLVKLKFVTVDK